MGESKTLELTERRALQITSGDDCLAIKGVSGSAGLGWARGLFALCQKRN